MTTYAKVLYVNGQVDDVEDTIQAFLDTIEPTSTPSITFWKEGYEYQLLVIYQIAE